jgi:hypothetical protein
MSSDSDSNVRALFAVPSKPVVLHPETVSAINNEMAAYAAREARLLIEIADLHKKLSSAKAYCEVALTHCMLPTSIQATAIRSAIEKCKT